MSTPKTGKVILVIEKFSQVTTYIQTSFSFADLTTFGIYPQIKLPHHSYHHNVFVYWSNVNGISENVHFEVSILNAKSEKLYTQEYNWEFDGLSACTALAFITRAKLLDPKNGYLVNDRLTLLCEAEIIDKKQINHDSIPQQNLNNLSEDFQSLLIDGKFSDATLIVGKDEKKFNVHKAILSSRSSVFAAMFEHDCEEKRQNEVKITDIDPETCDELLRYIYTGKAESLDQYAMELCKAADKYQLNSLKAICEQYLSSNLTIEIVANVLIFADLYRANELKVLCLDFIVNNPDKMKDTEGWKVLSNSKPQLLSELFFHFASKVKF